jgi:hypothetical protein
MAKILEGLKSSFSKEKEEEVDTNIDDVLEEEIIKKVVERYREENEYVQTEEEEVPESLKDLITIQTISSKAAVPLENHPSSTVRSIGSIYKRMGGFVDKVMSKLVNNRLLRHIDFELYSANIKLTATQYLALLTTISLLIFLVSIPIAPLVGVLVYLTTQ